MPLRGEQQGRLQDHLYRSLRKGRGQPYPVSPCQDQQCCGCCWKTMGRRYLSIV